MRYDAEHKERTRRKVLSEAAAAIRRHGPGGVGVAELMAKAGLTHGGFYAHFKSKDELIAEAITEMFDAQYRHFLACVEEREPAKGLALFVENYLSARHRDKPETGCPVPILSSDVARMPALARKHFTAGVERLTQAIAGILRSLDQPQPDRLAASLLAEMVGGLAVARALGDSRESDRILAATRESVLRRAGTIQPS